jgi:uncharacterized protein (TIGR03435 family)
MIADKSDVLESTTDLMTLRAVLPQQSEAIPRGDRDHCQSPHIAYLIIASFLLWSCWADDGIVAWGQVGTCATADSGTKPHVYETVSIKPERPGATGGSVRILPDGFGDTGVVFATLVRGAYHLMENQVLGMPTWAKSEPYDVEARVDSDTAEQWKKLTPKERWNQERPMLQALLAERCQLKVHRETKEMPVYDLVIAKQGLKMKEAAPDEQPSEQAGGGTIIVRAMAIDSLVAMITGTDGRLTVDRTGLGEKKFDFDLTWKADDQGTAMDSSPSLFTALEEQLGLKLVPSKGLVSVLVIDHMEKPSPN